MRHWGNVEFGGSFNHIEISGFIQSSQEHAPNKINSEVMVNMPEITDYFNTD